MNSSSHADNRFDFVRLLAALLVLFSHSFPLGGFSAPEVLGPTLAALPLGLAGVAIFFAVSGYLVAQSLMRSDHLLDFVWRRIVRIYPALIAVVALSIYVIGPQMTAVSPETYWTHEQTHRYWLNATAWETHYPLPSVFASNPHPHVVNGSLWSLAYELRCYVVLLLVAALPGGLRLKVTLVFMSLCWCWLSRPSVPPAGPFDTYWGLDYYHVLLGIYFSVGVLMSVFSQRNRLWVVLPLWAVGAVFDSSGLLMHLAYALFALWLAREATWLPSIPNRLGDLSYGVYLYAFPCQQILAAWGVQSQGFLIYTAFSVALTLAFSLLSWHILEKPMLRLKGLWRVSA